MCQLSCVMCHMSCVTCHLSYVKKLVFTLILYLFFNNKKNLKKNLDKVVLLIDQWGLLSTRPTPSSFLLKTFFEPPKKRLTKKTFLPKKNVFYQKTCFHQKTCFNNEKRFSPETCLCQNKKLFFSSFN